MTAIKLLGLLVLALVLCGCKIHYDHAIHCPTFEANGVAVWKWDTDTYFVLSEDGQHFLVSDLGCVVSAAQVK